MATRSAAPALPLTLQRGENVPLHQQLYDGLRQAIVAGQLAKGMRLPATRLLARELGLSRMTVVRAYEQLLAEGYVEGQVGAGTFVAEDLTEVVPEHARPKPTGGSAGRRELSRRGRMLAQTAVAWTRTGPELRAFRFGVPAVDLFPFPVWRRLFNARLRRLPPELLTYADPAGYRPLREAITEHLKHARGVVCTPEQVVVVAGSQQGLDLAARVLVDPGQRVVIEDPGYIAARGALQAAGAEIVSVRVDAEGLDVAMAARRARDARLIFVSPSHQFPLGVTMSLTRRLQLLDWARRSGAWVLEDDYDSDFRYTGRPLTALQGLDTDRRVVYLGTFSKSLFPSLRLGYLVVPPDVVEAFSSARALVDRQPPLLEQLVLCDFIREGHFAHHIRRMRKVYAERQAVLIDQARAILGDQLAIAPAAAGLHLIGWLPLGLDDRTIAETAFQRGVDVTPLSAYYALARNTPDRGGLVLGYGPFTRSAIRAGLRVLAQVLRVGG